MLFSARKKIFGFSLLWHSFLTESRRHYFFVPRLAVVGFAEPNPVVFNNSIFLRSWVSVASLSRVGCTDANRVRPKEMCWAIRLPEVLSHGCRC